MKGDSKATIWFVIGFVVIAIVGIILAAVYGSNQPVQASKTAGVAPVISSADWTIGNKNAKVSVIEYGDYQCPACANFAPLFKRLAEEYGDRVLFVFRNFPLYSVHANAGISAQAAEAAGLQGKYWEMNELIYKNQTDWESASSGDAVSKYFDAYATSLGLDVAKFNRDIYSDAVQNKVKTDADGGNAAQIDHTPTFFLNLQQIPNPASYDEFKSIIDKALAS